MRDAVDYVHDVSEAPELNAARDATRLPLRRSVAAAPGDGAPVVVLGDPGAPCNERLEFLGDAVLGLGRGRHRLPAVHRAARGRADRSAQERRQRGRPGRGRRGDRPRLACCSARARTLPVGARSRRSSPMPSKRCSARSTSTAAAVAYDVHRRLSAPASPRPSTASTSSTTRRACRRSPPARFDAPVYVLRAEDPTTPSGSSRRCARRPHSARARAGRRRRPSRGRVRGVRAARRRLTVRRPACRPIPNVACLSSPRSRPSGVDSPASSSAGASNASRSAGERTVRRTSAQAVIDGLTGATIVAANRRGKYLLAAARHRRRDDDPPADERPVAGAARRGAPPPHTHVVLHLDGGNELRFVDPRTFGEVVVFDPTNVAVEVPELARLGVDPIADGLDAEAAPPARAFGQPPAQGAAARPARDRRHRQHLRRRDPARRPAAPRPGLELADAAVGGDAARRDPRRALGARSSPAARRCATRSTST